MFSVFAYGSQNALMLNHAYNAGVISTPITMIHVFRTRISRVTSLLKIRQLIRTSQAYAICTALCTLTTKRLADHLRGASLPSATN